MKKIICLMMTAMLLLTGCGGKSRIDDPAIIGTWKFEDKEYISEYTFNDDGTFTEVVSSVSFGKLNTYTGKFTLENGKISVNFDNDAKYPFTYNITINEDKMMWYGIVVDMEYIKQE